MAFIAGPYNITMAGVSVGQCVDVSVEHFVNKQLVRGDTHAQTPQDGVYQGMEVFVEFTMIEYDSVNFPQVALTLWPYAADGAQGQVGRLDVASSLVTTLVLTPKDAGAAVTTAGLLTADQFTATRAILAEGFPVRILHAPALAEVPIRLRLYPSAAGLFYLWS